MTRKEKKVAVLAAQAQEFLVKGDSVRAETAYKHAFNGSVRFLGLHHASTRNLLSIYAMCLKGAHKSEQALRYEALYWKTARPETYRLGQLFGEVDSEVQDFLKNNGDLIEELGQEISQTCHKRRCAWNSAENALASLRAYLRNLRQYVLELGK